jgi:hypothetical protein
MQRGPGGRYACQQKYAKPDQPSQHHRRVWRRTARNGPAVAIALPNT